MIHWLVAASVRCIKHYTAILPRLYCVDMLCMDFLGSCFRLHVIKIHFYDIQCLNQIIICNIYQRRPCVNPELFRNRSEGSNCFVIFTVNEPQDEGLQHRCKKYYPAEKPERNLIKDVLKPRFSKWGPWTPRAPRATSWGLQNNK